MRKRLCLSLALSAALWLLFAWPLPRYLASGIPCSSTNIEKGAVRRMMAGDHLQLHYFYWLFSDMLAGKTPWFSNVYEFNLGDDAARRRVGVYNMPFSFVYAAGRAVAGRAFGWNLTGFVVLWLTHFITWLLLRRHTDDDRTAALVALIGVALPYRWETLLGGSPTGSAMLWVPLLMLGLDLAGRSFSARGAVLAAVALVFAYLHDRHVFFFGILLLPGWLLVLLVLNEEFRWRPNRSWLRLARAMLPFLLIVLALLMVAGRAKKKGFAGTNMAPGRTIEEVAIYSPEPHAPVSWRDHGKNAHAYVGFSAPLLLLLGLAVLIGRFRRDRRRYGRLLAALALLLAGTAGIVCLALGPNGPFDGALFKGLRAAMPGYEMIRQPAKVFCLLPACLAVACLLAVRVLRPLCRTPRSSAALPAVAAVLIVAEYAAQVRPTICLLDTEQAAYEAVARDAADPDRPARALVVPLWPGDSAWASLYEHYVSLYRIRMINGYTPIVPESYRQTVFKRYGSVNVGVLSDEQLDELRLERKIDYVILHEDAFPEKVSPFPVCFTLKRFLNHPRLALLKQGQNVWAFKILAQPVPRPDVKPAWDLFFPARQWELDKLACTAAEVAADESASGGERLTLAGGGTVALTNGFSHWDAPDAVLKLRLKGHGAVAVELGAEPGLAPVPVAVDSDAWQWIDVDLADAAAAGPRIVPRVEWRRGTVHLDMMTFVSGHWPPAPAAGRIELPAALFFHAGYIDRQKDSVWLRRAYQPDDAVFYGLGLPLPAGEYELELVCRSPAPAGVKLGKLRMTGRGIEGAERNVIAGRRALGTFVQKSNLPVRIEFVFKRNADVEIERVVLNSVGTHIEQVKPDT